MKNWAAVMLYEGKPSHVVSAHRSRAEARKWCRKYTDDARKNGDLPGGPIKYVAFAPGARVPRCRFGTQTVADIDALCEG